MAHSPLLPGVDGRQPIEPSQTAQASAIVRRARRDAFFRDAIDASFLIALDVFFIRWPVAHVPYLDRGQSMVLVALMHAVMITNWFVARRFPAWRARRIARTWCPGERKQLTARKA